MKRALVVLAFALPATLQAASSPIEVRFEVTEVDQSKAARLGVEWPSSARFTEAGGSTVGIGSIERLTKLQADIHFLEQEGAAELLANPNLVTDSGTSASFHAGGELPYVTSTALGSSHVEFKPYGVIVTARPHLLEDGRIRMKVTAAVSSPDQANGAAAGNLTVPALRERKVQSSVTLRDGTTMMLAGLVQDERERVETGVPVLRRVPVLGALFRWKRTNRRRTTIIVFVTPKVVPL